MATQDKFYRQGGKIYVEYVEDIPSIDEAVPDEFLNSDDYAWWREEYDKLVDNGTVRSPVKIVTTYEYREDIDGPLPPEEEIENR